MASSPQIPQPIINLSCHGVAGCHGGRISVASSCRNRGIWMSTPLSPPENDSLVDPFNPRHIHSIRVPHVTWLSYLISSLIMYPSMHPSLKNHHLPSIPSQKTPSDHQLTIWSFNLKLSESLHPQLNLYTPKKLTWNLNMPTWKRKIINPNHQVLGVPAVSFRGCTNFYLLNSSLYPPNQLHNKDIIHPFSLALSQKVQAPVLASSENVSAILLGAAPGSEKFKWWKAWGTEGEKKHSQYTMLKENTKET